MPLKRMVMELGMGTDLQGEDYTKAASRAVMNALRQNSLTIAPAFGRDKEEMHVVVKVGIAKPDQVDPDAISALLPYGTREVEVHKGGMDTPSEDGTCVTVMANAALIVYLDLPDDFAQGMHS